MNPSDLSVQSDATTLPQNEVELMQAAVLEIGTARDTSSALTAVLRRVCEKTAWILGQAWLPDRDGTSLEHTAVWVNAPPENLQEFISISWRTKFAPGEGLPGRVWSSRQPAWVPDVAADVNFPRSRQAKAAGITTALAVPVLAGDEVVAVLEFFLREQREENDLQTAMIAVVAAQLGWTLRHKRAHDALKASEERYRVLVEKAPICIHEIDEEGRLTAVNPAGLRMLGGADPSQVCGISALRVVSSSDQERIAALLVRAFAGEFSEFEFVAMTAGDEPRTFLSCFIPLHDKDGAIRKVLGMSQDITHHKMAEEQLRQAQKMQAVGRLAGGVAHDFNNVLSVIIGYSYLLQGEPSAEKVDQIAAEILKAADRATSLTRQMLNFSRKQAIQIHTTELNGIVRGISSMLQRLIGADIELDIQLANDLPCVTADNGQIEQVIMNLVVNARDAMPQGGNLTIATSNVQLDEEHAAGINLPPGRYALLTVSDTGQGMDPKTQAHIFEPFFTTKDPGHGTGIGLATVHGIVTQSGGRIGVQSKVGEGTTFDIYLPATAKHAFSTVHAAVLPTARAIPATILLVEDEESLRKLTEELLQAEGYTVLEAANGTAALEAASVHPGKIQLLLTDMAMPGIPGRDLAKRLRSQDPEIKVLYIAGFADPNATREIGTRVLEKPFTPDALLRNVHDILAGQTELAVPQAN